MSGIDGDYLLAETNDGYIIISYSKEGRTAFLYFSRKAEAPSPGVVSLFLQRPHGITYPEHVLEDAARWKFLPGTDEFNTFGDTALYVQRLSQWLSQTYVICLINSEEAPLTEAHTMTRSQLKELIKNIEWLRKLFMKEAAESESQTA